MHHKFAVIDFDLPTARVYFGSYNFSSSADTKNGENVLVFKDRKIAVAYMIEALRILHHYSFRLAQKNAQTAQKELGACTSRRANPGGPRRHEDWTSPAKKRDRLLFAEPSRAQRV